MRGCDLCVGSLPKVPPHGPPAPLSPPRALTLATVTPRTIHLTWQPSAGATHYLVRCSPASSKGEEEEREVSWAGG